MPSFPALLSIDSLLNESKWAITSPKKGQAMQRYHEEQSARSKGARLSPLEKFTKILRKFRTCTKSTQTVNSNPRLEGGAKLHPTHGKLQGPSLQ